MGFKRFFIGVIGIAFFVVGVLYPSLFFLQLGVPRSNTLYINEWFKVKDKYAASIRTNKIMIISGSNTLFSVSANTIEKEIGIPTVNYGVHAGLGLQYILWRAQKHLKKGDIVILPLEYELYKETIPFGGEYSMYISSFDQKYFFQLSYINKLKFAYSMRFSEIRQGIKELLFRKEGEIRTGYSDLGLNINGDIIGNCVEKSDKSKIKTDMLNKLEINGVLSYDVKKLLDEFISYCGNNKIKVIVTFPAYYMPFKELKEGQYTVIDEITQFWLQRRDVVLLSTFIDNIYDVNDFYDGNYHMNDRGRIKRTSQLIKELEFLSKRI